MIFTLNPNDDLIILSCICDIITVVITMDRQGGGTYLPWWCWRVCVRARMLACLCIVGHVSKAVKIDDEFLRH